jgi:hypothetical protein
MWSRAKQLLQHGLNILLALILILGCISYVGINAVLMTEVINDLRLDTYITLETGFGIVMLVLFLGWGPVWLMRSLRNSR